jgi:glutathione S-transferase
MSIVIHAFPPSPRSFKVLLVAEHLGVDYRMQFTDLAAGEHRRPESARLNVNQRMPVLVDGDYVLWESNAIIEYLASLKPEAGLIPSDLKARLQVAKWLYWEAAHWDPACLPFVVERVAKPLIGLGEPDEAEIARAGAAFERVAGVLDNVLENQRHVAGERLTLADFALAAPLCHAERAGIPLAGYGSIGRWFADIRTLPAWGRASAAQVRPKVPTAA